MSDPWEPIDDGCETHEWRSASGDTIRFVTRTGATARMMPPVSLTTIRVPQAHGGRFRGARHDERLLVLPIVFPGPQTTGREELRRWARALDPARGEGTITVVEGPYAGRVLVCAYEAGLSEMAEDNGQPLEVGNLAFRAAEPYWLDGSEQEVIASLGDEQNLWFPFAGTWAAQPLVLGASEVFATTVIDNPGDVDAWPVITVTGPGDSLVIRNDTTELEMEITGSIALGEVLLIDTRPGHKTVTLDGVNAFSRLTDESVLWPLIPGPNRVSIGYGAVTVASTVKFTWRARWLAA
jgi:hypothetical protein